MWLTYHLAPTLHPSLYPCPLLCYFAAPHPRGQGGQPLLLNLGPNMKFAAVGGKLADAIQRFEMGLSRGAHSPFRHWRRTACSFPPRGGRWLPLYATPAFLHSLRMHTRAFLKLERIAVDIFFKNGPTLHRQGEGPTAVFTPQLVTLGVVSGWPTLGSLESLS